MLSFFSKKWEELYSWLQLRKKPSIQDSADQRYLLCVDDDPDFCFYIQRLAKELEITLDKAYSIAEAKQKIEEGGIYQAFIIDGHLPDGSGFELVAWLREKKDLDAPIAFLSRIYQDAASFRILKETLKVDFVLDKPINPGEVKRLLKQMCRIEAQLSEPSEEDISDNFLAEITERYQRSISDKLERLEKMILAIQKAPTSEHMQAFKMEIHKIAGSSGSYGYPRVGELCKEMEKNLADKIELVKLGKFNSAWLASLDEFFTQIKLNFQIPQAEEKKEKLKATDFSLLPLIYAVTNEPSLLSLLETTRSSGQIFRVLTEPDPQVALEKLAFSEFAPQVLLVNARYGNQGVSGYDLIRPFYQKKEERISTVAMAVPFEDASEQSRAIKRGIQFVLIEPLSKETFWPLLEQAMMKFALKGYRILVVDDDPDVCQYIALALRLTGADITVVQDFADLQHTLTQQSFDAILLDVNLAEEKTIAALNALKAVNRDHLTLPMVTVTKDIHLVQTIYDARVDDVLFKPLEGRSLQKRIFDLLSKARKEASKKDRDTLTGLFNLSYFYQCLQIPLDNNAETLVAFEIKQLAELIKISENRTEEEIVTHINQSLDQLLKKYEMAAYAGNGRFVLLFKGLDPWFLRLFMSECLKELHQDIQELMPESTPIRLIGTVIPLQTTFRSFDQMESEIQSALQEVASYSNQLVLVKVWVENEIVEPVESSKALIVSDQLDRIESLENAFQQLDCEVSLATDLEERLFERSSQKKQTALPLLVMVGESAISQGIALLQKLSEQNQWHLPVLYFPTIPSLDKLQELLGESGVNYLNYPFNLMILIETVGEN
ncbi:Conserved hypothetical protein [Candidatus Protochlamydia naegleriophila]|uniref:Response regulator n=1 Tax=Candidatus Protochlamydia naegleriophila TaxID=389348 RepID=A0A0U5EQF1_9BACT|nr:response regulator [Candidatus Protochlamydia naegleriophila]CUI16355.1 Conserved hypothetical protein [Candidatus Protochlamydia naegleriophila]